MSLYRWELAPTEENSDVSIDSPPGYRPEHLCRSKEKIVQFKQLPLEIKTNIINSYLRYLKHKKLAELEVIDKKCWKVSLDPMKYLPINLLFIWIFGTELSIFTLSQILLIFYNSLRGLLNFMKMIKLFRRSKNCIYFSITYIAGNLVYFITAVNKLNSWNLFDLNYNVFFIATKYLEFCSGGMQF